jgi:hypothetical protein
MKISEHGLEDGNDEELQKLRELVDRLTKENQNYRLDNIYKLFFAMNRKAGEIADGLNDATLQLEGEDKVFERFLKLVEKLEPLVKTLASLRQDYLKIPEEEVAEAEKKGIPPIERRAKKKNV